MLKLFRELKRYALPLVLLLCLIAVQAYCWLMLPDYMSKIISEGIKSPAYETTGENGSGYPIAAVIDTAAAPLFGEGAEAFFAVSIYQRTGESTLYVDNGVAFLADDNGEPLLHNGQNYGIIAYEKTASGKYIIDATTGMRIVRYARKQGGVFVNDPILHDSNNEARSVGTESAVIAPAVVNVAIYDFKKNPASLALDEFGNAVFAGFYMNGAAPAMLKMGNAQIPAFRFARNGTEGELRLSGGFAQLKQVSYPPLILRYGLIMLVYTLISSACALSASFIASQISAKVSRNIRGKIYDKVQLFSLEQTDKFGTASLVTRSTNDVNQFQQVLYMLLRLSTMTPIMFAGALILALSKDVQMTAILAISIPLILVAICVAGVVVIPIFKKMQERVDKLTLVSREGLTGVRVIKAFGQELAQREKFDGVNSEVTAVAVKANRIMSFIMPLMTFIMNATSLGIVFMAVQIAKSDIFGTTFTDFGNMMAVTQYVMHVMFSLLMFIMVFLMVPRAAAAAARINEVLDTPLTVKDCDKPASLGECKGVVEFKNVGFKFLGASENILSDINFVAKPDTVTAVIGGTGSGKSTVINLIPRFYDVTEGSVCIDGVSVSGVSQAELRKHIAFIPQKAQLFSGSIADNIRFGKEDATEEEIISALKLAEAWEFVGELADKINAHVEQGGANFSGGQKQRLCIARALVKKAPVLIFDDAFSALDFATDSRLRKNLREHIKGVTVIIVAQRIGTIADADNIIVLDDGKQIASGTHKQLMDACPVYRELALSQISQDEIESLNSGAK